MYLRQQTAGRFELTVNESRIEDQLDTIIGDLRLSRAFNPALHRFEVPLDAVHANSKRVNQVEALTVLRQHRRKHAVDNVSIVR